MRTGGRALRVVLLTHYFPPEIRAPQSRLYELAARTVASGHEVTVLTTFPNYPTGVIPDSYRRRFRVEEKIDGIRVIRTWVYATPNRGFLRRLLNHLSFALSSLTAASRLGHVDVFFVESPPLFIGLAALTFQRLKRAPFIFNVSDIWPQSAVELGALKNRLAIRLAEWLEMHLYLKAARISVVTPGMLERLVARGVPRERMALLTNGVDTLVFRPAQPNIELARRLGLGEYKVFLYAGTHGMAQGLDTVLEAARRTRNTEVLYVLAGEGAEKEVLMQQARSQGLDNVRFLPNQPKREMPDLINLAYSSIVPLKRLDLFRSALPSKMFESMAVARPIVASLWGEAADMVEFARCGIVIEPESPEAMAAAVERLAADPRLAHELGENGRRYVEKNFDRETIARRFVELLETAARPAPSQ